MSIHTAADIRHMRDDLDRGREAIEAAQLLCMRLPHEPLEAARDHDVRRIRDQLGRALVETGSLRHRLDLAEALTVAGIAEREAYDSMCREGSFQRMYRDFDAWLAVQAAAIMLPVLRGVARAMNAPARARARAHRHTRRRQV